MKKKDLCRVFGGEGTLKGRSGLFRIVVMALTKEAARDILGASDYAMNFYHTSKLTQEWALFDETTSIGDVFAAPRGTKDYEPVDPEDVEA